MERRGNPAGRIRFVPIGESALLRRVAAHALAEGRVDIVRVVDSVTRHPALPFSPSSPWTPAVGRADGDDLRMSDEPTHKWRTSPPPMPGSDKLEA